MISANDLIAKFRYALDNKWGYIYGTAGILWTQAKQDATSNEQARKYGQQWVGHYVADCSGLFSWAFKQLGGYMYHGSNTMYLSYCVNKGELKNGKRTDGGELLPGTAVFIWKPDDQKYGHVGLYIGNDTVIEAYGTTKGVITSKASNKKWTNWGWLKGVEDGDVPVGKPTLRKGDKGEYVTLAQTELMQKGYDLGKWGADGSFGAATEAAVKSFQKDNGLAQDGIIGEKTWAALDAPVSTLWTVTIPHMTKHQAEGLVTQYAGAYMTEEGGA